MPLAFSASQQLQLAVAQQPERLADYLTQHDRVVKALLNPDQLHRLGDGRYRYAVTHLHVFQLQIHPVVQLRSQTSPGRIELEAIDCQLEGLGVVDDFQLTLRSWLENTGAGLTGEAQLDVQVSRPPLLRVIPVRVLEATGRSLLAGILLGIKGRVGQQLLADYQSWLEES